jgi:acyl phosphate:glycerol-3-phosphate acyltransferase
MVIAAWVLAAYALGSIAFAVVVSRAFRLPDPRSFGSGNPGATNVLRTGNKWAAACTLAGDALKGWAAVWLARAYSGAASVDDPTVAAVAVAVFLGHLYPVFFSFKGGKGVATALGILFALDWRLGGAALGVWIGVFAATRISSLSALTAAVVAPLVAWSALGRGWATGAVALLAILVLWRHRANIANLLAGSEPKARRR